MSKVIYGNYGVLSGQGRAPVGISEARISDDGKTLSFDGNLDSTEKWPVTKLNIFQRSGTMYFRSKGVEYTVRELRDNDGLWLSKYGVLLPEEALSALIKIGGHVDSNEQFMAVATDDSPYIVAVTYSNGNGTFSRQDGQWIKLAENDTTFDSMIPMPVDPSKVKDFLDLYDHNFVSVSDAQKYESPENKDGVAPQDRPAEEA